MTADDVLVVTLPIDDGHGVSWALAIPGDLAETLAELYQERDREAAA